MLRRSAILAVLVIMLAFVAGCDQARTDEPVLRWERVAGLPPGAVVDVAATAGGFVLASLEDEGVYRSLDGGESWQHVLGVPDGLGTVLLAIGSGVLKGAHVTSMAIGASSQLFAGTKRGLFRARTDPD